MPIRRSASTAPQDTTPKNVPEKGRNKDIPILTEDHLLWLSSQSLVGLPICTHRHYHFLTQYFLI